MPSHRLILEKAKGAGEWLLEWDEVTLRLSDPEGQRGFEHPVLRAHRIIEIYELDVGGKVSFATSDGSMTFAKNSDAARDVRELMLRGLRLDADYRHALKRTSRRMVWIGVAVFFVSGGLFGAYCWWAGTAGDPGPDSWIRSVGPLMHLGLLVLLAGALAGPVITFSAIRSLNRIREVERSLDA
jgi:hypothetical protein